MKNRGIFFFLAIFIFFGALFLMCLNANVAKAAESSQCDAQNKNCKHDNDASILAGQCTTQYGQARCGSMSSYLAAMKADCEEQEPSGIDCATIASGGYYGNEAAKFAAFKGGGSGGDIPLAASGGCPEGMRPEGNLCFPVGTGLSEKPVVGIATGILNWMLGLFGSLGILTFVVSGIFYLTAAGDADQEKKAKNAMNMGIIGIIVGLSGFVIIKAIDTILNGGM